MDLDLDRWNRLRDALANANDASPAFMLLQDAHGRAARARADLETYQRRGAAGQPTRRHPDVIASFDRGVKELEQRVAEAEHEVQRLDSLQRESGAARRQLQTLIDGIREWAASEPILLAGDEEISMARFSPSSVRLPAPPVNARTFP